MVTKVRGSGRDHSAYRPQKLFLLATKWRIPLSSCLSRGEKTAKVSDGEDVCSAEIERVLLSHPEVQDAVVLGVPDSKWREVDAAYLVARKQGGIAPEIILEFVNTRLARHKLPNEICFLDSLPPNASEAINKLQARYRSAGVRQFWVIQCLICRQIVDLAGRYNSQERRRLTLWVN